VVSTSRTDDVGGGAGAQRPREDLPHLGIVEDRAALLMLAVVQEDTEVRG
jgi:hypothetical protein